jgi:hypothetical protein
MPFESGPTSDDSRHKLRGCSRTANVHPSSTVAVYGLSHCDIMLAVRYTGINSMLQQLQRREEA